MSQTKQAKASERTSVPLLGVAGVSVALAGRVSAKPSGSGADIPSGDTAARHEKSPNLKNGGGFGLSDGGSGAREVCWS
jgi:hypothetical protein